MKSAFFIMELWQTGNIGSSNIAKIKNNPKDGFTTYELGKSALVDLFMDPKSEVNQQIFANFTVMELFWKA